MSLSAPSVFTRRACASTGQAVAHVNGWELASDSGYVGDGYQSEYASWTDYALRDGRRLRGGRGEVFEGTDQHVTAEDVVTLLGKAGRAVPGAR